jgi:broad specificity phosphatase PhoE
MIIYLIRHGETTGDIEDRYGGNYDDHLTNNGIKQAKELAENLKDKGIQIIFSSPKIRAKETAQIVSKTLNIKLEIANDLRERNNYGILTGMIKSEAKEKYPEEVEKLEKNELRHNVANSEDYESFKKRIVNAFEGIINDNKYETVAIVSHGGPIRCIVREILKLGEIKHLKDCEILEIKKEGNKINLKNMKFS